MTREKKYSELIELIIRLQKEGRPEDAKVCVNALYCLQTKDGKIEHFKKEAEDYKFFYELDNHKRSP